MKNKLTQSFKQSTQKDIRAWQRMSKKGPLEALIGTIFLAFTLTVTGGLYLLLRFPRFFGIPLLAIGVFFGLVLIGEAHGPEWFILGVITGIGIIGFLVWKRVKEYRNWKRSFGYELQHALKLMHTPGRWHSDEKTTTSELASVLKALGEHDIELEPKVEGRRADLRVRNAIIECKQDLNDPGELDRLKGQLMNYRESSKYYIYVVLFGRCNPRYEHELRKFVQRNIPACEIISR